VFNRTRIINHTLNEKSLLVKEIVKKMIKQNKEVVRGWSSDICEPKHIRTMVYSETKSKKGLLILESDLRQQAE